MATLDSRPTATTLDIEELVRDAWSGRIRVPHFQRDFRWRWTDVRRLFDSIVKGYPIGSLLLWMRKAEKQTLNLGALRIDAPASEWAYWVVDGQQRLTSIANALHRDGYRTSTFGLAYDLRQEDFVHPPQVEDPAIVPLPVLFDLQAVIKWFAENPGIAQYLDHATNVTRKLRQFEVPAYLVTQDDPEVLTDIFDRMNNYGMRLSRAEVFSALNAGDEIHQNGALTFEQIAERLDAELQFGVVDNDTVLAAILARRGPDVRREIRSEFRGPNDEGRDAAYAAGEQALYRAIRFLQGEAGVPHISMLAYRYLLVVLTRIFAHHPEPDPRSVRLLRRWYWQAATVGPEYFRGGTPNVARILCGKVSETDLNRSIRDLLDAVDSSVPRIPSVERFSTSEAATKMLLCSWWSTGPINPTTGQAYEQTDLANSLSDQQTARDIIRYLVPPKVVPVEQRKWAANRVLMPGMDVDPKEASSQLVTRSVNVHEAQWQAMLDSYVLSTAMVDVLERGDIEAFLDLRQEAVRVQLAAFLNSMAEWQFEDTPPLASLIVDDIDDDDDD